MVYRMNSEKGSPTNTTEFFAPELRVWRGIAPLSVAFWFYGIFASWIQIALYALAVYHENVFIQQMLLIIFATYTVWILISIWRCSQPPDTLWSLTARLLTVVWAANAAMVLLFLQLDLLVFYVGR